MLSRTGLPMKSSRLRLFGGLAIGVAALLSNVAQSTQSSSDAEQAPAAAPHAAARGLPTQIEQNRDVKEVQAEVIVLHGTNDGKGVDPALPADVRGKLEKPPFSSFNSYKLLEKHELKLPKGEAKEKKLPDGGKMSLLFKEVSPGKKKDDPTKFVLSATIEKADGKQFLPGLDVNTVKGDYFFIAGQKYNGGILVIGVKVI